MMSTPNVERSVERSVEKPFSKQMTTDLALEKNIQRQLESQSKYCSEFKIENELTPGWLQSSNNSRTRLYNNDNTINFDNLKSFRRRHIFCIDNGPYTDYSSFTPKKWIKSWIKSPLKETKLLIKQFINGTYRGQNKQVARWFEILKKENALELLKKFDVSKTAGNPWWYEKEGYSYNGRWLHHIYFLNLIGKTISPQLRQIKDLVCLDLGCSYGIHSYMLSKEFTGSKHICVDLPDQLILTHYFIQKSIPDARIATVADFCNVDKIDKNFLENFEFVLVPPNYFHKIVPGTVDVFTNYNSLGEMQRKWFSTYLDSPLFKSIKYFVTCNRFVSSPYFAPTHSNDITIRDYPLDDFKSYWFDVNPFYFNLVNEKKRYFYEVLPVSCYFFTFIGKRKSL